MSALVESSRCSPDQQLAIAFPVEGPGTDLGYVDLQEGIRYAMSWSELEGWIERARESHQQNRLDDAEMEELMEQAIQISRCIPEP